MDNEDILNEKWDDDTKEFYLMSYWFAKGLTLTLEQWDYYFPFIETFGKQEIRKGLKFEDWGDIDVYIRTKKQLHIKKKIDGRRRRRSHQNRLG